MPVAVSGSTVKIEVSLPKDVAKVRIENDDGRGRNIWKASSSTSGSFSGAINKAHGYYLVELFDSNGNPVKNKNIDITVNGKTVSAFVDGDGSPIYFDISADSNVKSADISYTSNVEKEQQTPSQTQPPAATQKTTTTTSKATKVATKIKAHQKTFKVKTKVKKYTVTLKDKKGKIIKNKKVALKIKGKTYIVKTNNKGKAIFKIKLNKKGKYLAKLSFAGDAKYKASKATTKIIIK